MPNLSNNLTTLSRRWDTHLLLVWSCILLLPLGRSVELPTAIMAISAGVLWYQARLSPWNGRYRAFTLAFFLVWIPMAISVPAAELPAEALRVTGLYMRFYFAGLFIIWVIDSAARRDLFLRLVAWLLLLWIIDALIQFVFGFDLFGQAYPKKHLTGPFGSELKLGLVLTTLSPFLLSWARERLPGWGSLLVLGLLLFVVMASGNRGSWVMFTIVLISYFILFLKEHRAAAAKYLTLAIVSALLITTLAYRYAPPITDRVDQTLLLFSGDVALIDKALSNRLPIWSHALEMIRDHPVNGVGVRNFRDVYPDYAVAGDYFLSKDTVPHHPHQILLEFTAEAGLIGLAGLIALYLLLIRSWRKASRQQCRLALPAGVGLLAWLFPLNTGVALFSSFWGQLIWWLAALFFALLSIHGIKQPAPAAKPSPPP